MKYCVCIKNCNQIQFMLTFHMFQAICTRHTPNSSPKRNIPAWSSRLYSPVLIFPYPSSPKSRTLYQLPPVGPMCQWDPCVILIHSFTPSTPLPSPLSLSLFSPTYPRSSSSSSGVPWWSSEVWLVAIPAEELARAEAATKARQPQPRQSSIALGARRASVEE
jgi:hypothetical protein